ncbi:MAG TPA: cytochrome c maturation protein CcmE [Candidatus Binatia bacterium]|jgi:cytochrome c-type biogenesis protein CcmE
MSTRKRFLIGGFVILAAVSYLIVGGMKEAMVYFKMPSELRAEESSMKGKFVRMGGMVVKGSLHKDLQNLTYRFDLTDGNTTFPIFFKGVPPDLFTEGKGAVVEGRIGSDGVFHATTIMAKHAEEYSPHTDAQSSANSFIPAKETLAR